VRGAEPGVYWANAANGTVIAETAIHANFILESLPDAG